MTFPLVIKLRLFPGLLWDRGRCILSTFLAEVGARWSSDFNHLQAHTPPLSWGVNWSRNWGLTGITGYYWIGTAEARESTLSFPQVFCAQSKAATPVLAGTRARSHQTVATYIVAVFISLHKSSLAVPYENKLLLTSSSYRHTPSQCSWQSHPIQVWRAKGRLNDVARASC